MGGGSSCIDTFVLSSQRTYLVRVLRSDVLPMVDHGRPWVDHGSTMGRPWVDHSSTTVDQNPILRFWKWINLFCKWINLFSKLWKGINLIFKLIHFRNKLIHFQIKLIHFQSLEARLRARATGRGRGGDCTHVYEDMRIGAHSTRPEARGLGGFCGFSDLFAMSGSSRSVRCQSFRSV